MMEMKVTPEVSNVRESVRLNGAVDELGKRYSFAPLRLMSSRTRS